MSIYRERLEFYASWKLTHSFQSPGDSPLALETRRYKIFLTIHVSESKFAWIWNHPVTKMKVIGIQRALPLRTHRYKIRPLSIPFAILYLQNLVLVHGVQSSFGIADAQRVIRAQSGLDTSIWETDADVTWTHISWILKKPKESFRHLANSAQRNGRHGGAVRGTIQNWRKKWRTFAGQCSICFFERLLLNEPPGR